MKVIELGKKEVMSDEKNIIDFNLMTISEVAKALKKGKSTVRTWIRREVIPKECIRKIACSVYIKRDKFTEWLVA